MPESITYNIDCLEYMRKLPDNFFDLAVADPPFGDGIDHENGVKSGDRFDGSRMAKYREDRAPTYNRFGTPGSRFEKYKSAPNMLLSADGEPMSTHTHTAPKNLSQERAVHGQKSTVKKL